MRRRRLWATIAALTGALAASALFVLAAGAPLGSVLRTLFEGAFLSRASIGETLTRMTPIVLTALGAVLAFKAGVLNIGLDGQLLAGAAAAAAAGAFCPGPPAFVRLVVLAASLAAGAAAVVPAVWLAEKRNVPEVLSTILLNLVAAAHVSWLVRGPLRDPLGDYPQSPPLSDAVRLPALLEGSRATIAVPAALVIAAVLWVFLTRTFAGLALRASGESPLAARAAGLSDVLIRRNAFAVSGALAGLAGGLEVLAVTGRLYDPFSAGTGYTGIAAALVGGLSPVGASLASFLLAGLAAGAGAMQRDAGVPAAISFVVPALAVLAVLAVRGSLRRPR